MPALRIGRIVAAAGQHRVHREMHAIVGGNLARQARAHFGEVAYRED